MNAEANHFSERGQVVGLSNPFGDVTEHPFILVCDRVLEAAKYIPPEQLGTNDDCGFSPFSDDTSTTRETAFGEDTRQG